MTAELVLGLAVGLGLSLYLFHVLARPERF